MGTTLLLATGLLIVLFPLLYVSCFLVGSIYSIIHAISGGGRRVKNARIKDTAPRGIIQHQRTAKGRI